MKALTFIACLALATSISAQSNSAVYHELRQQKEELEGQREELASLKRQLKGEPESDLARFNEQQIHEAKQQEERRLQPIGDAALSVRVKLYTQELESLVGMPPMQEGEDPDVHRRELSLRISQISDQRLKARVQTVLDKLEPAAAWLTQVPAESDARSDQDSPKFNAAVQKSREIAIARYPECADPSSDLSRKMIEIADRLEARGNKLVYQADAPERVADMAAGELKIAPNQ